VHRRGGHAEEGRGRRDAVADLVVAVAGDQVHVPGLHGLAVEGTGPGGQDPDHAAVGSRAQHDVPGLGDRDRLAARPRDRVDVARLHAQAVEGAWPRRYTPDPGAAGVAEHDVAVPVERYPRRVVQLGRPRRAAVARKADLPGPGDGVDVPGPHRPAV